MFELFENYLPYVLVTLQLLTMLACAVFLLSGLDDVLIDLCFVTRGVLQRLSGKHGLGYTLEDIQRAPEKRIAVMVPAWDEADVIARMLGNTLNTLRYENYNVFVGTYPNDEATQREVESARMRSPRIEKVVLPHAGPSNKADCLNWIYQGIRAYEHDHNVQFDVFVLQDSEDVIHPLCYKLFNFLIPRYDMVQLPVQSFAPRWYAFTAGHYVDEFAQGHYKDMVVRELLSGSLPSAGVGTAFSRRALGVLADAQSNELFATDSLTEDYDVGLRLQHHGLRQHFVRFPIVKTEYRPRRWGSGMRKVEVTDYICVREHFPAKARAAARQKSRWVVGIALQGWARLGWKGNLGTKYHFLRDRKALVTNFVNILGYVIVAAVSIMWLVTEMDPDGYRYPPIIEPGTWPWEVMQINAWLLAWRVMWRALCVQRYHGWVQALLSAPRMVWGNFINFLATARAIFLYARYLVTGRLIAWDKTAHTYPSEAELRARHRRIGDVLLERRVITLEQLDSALVRQQQQHEPLGQILKRMGVLGERDIESALEAH